MSDYLNTEDMRDYEFKFKNLEDLQRFNQILDEERIYREVYKSELRIIVLSIFPDVAEKLKSYL